MDRVLFNKLDSVNSQVMADPGIINELASELTFDVPAARFSPKFKMGAWDGKIRLLNKFTGGCYTGLYGRVATFCTENGYKFVIDPELVPRSDVPEDVGDVISREFNAPLEPYYYQNEIVHQAFKYKRRILLCPTAGGKSFAIYLIARKLAEHNKRTLIITTSINLVDQMGDNFEEFNNDKPCDVHKIAEGASKDSDAAIVVSTWQAIQKQPKKWFAQFNAIIGDEVHRYDGKALKGIMEKAVTAEYRIGMTGTLKDSKTHILTLEGLFGPTHRVASLRELIDGGFVVEPKIKILVLRHKEEDRKQLFTTLNKLRKDPVKKNRGYATEVDALLNVQRRNLYIRNLAKALKGNTLILFRFVEKHGHILLPLMEEINDNVFYIDGSVSGTKRKEIRLAIDQLESSITIASFQTFATGSSVNRIDNLILGSPSKSKVQNMQSIGRTLRLAPGKTHSNIYDIADDFRYGKAQRENYTLSHMRIRADLYDDEQLEYKIRNVEM